MLFRRRLPPFRVTGVLRGPNRRRLSSYFLLVAWFPLAGVAELADAGLKVSDRRSCGFDPLRRHPLNNV